MKTCKDCGEEKPRSEFSKHRSTRDRLQPKCKACNAEWLRTHRRENPEWWLEYNRQYKAKNRQKILEQRRKRYHANPEVEARRVLGWRMKKQYGITLKEYDELVSQPCGLCGSTDRVVLDHDHTTGVLRGPLCNLCNTAIGKLGDDPARLRAAADYIEEHRKEVVPK